jgi:hypothetical protein
VNGPSAVRTPLWEYDDTHIFVLVKRCLKVLVVSKLDVSKTLRVAVLIERNLHSGDLWCQSRT